MENIIPGYYVAKPVATQEECDAYSAMASAVNEHNAACKVGDTLWGIEDKADRYEVIEAGTLPEPESAQPTLEEQVASLKAENAILTDQLTDLQVALYSLYEQSEEGETT